MTLPSATRRIVGGELESIGSNSLQALWMRSRAADGFARYTIPDINYFPSGATAVAIAALLITAVWTDYTGKRYQVNLLIAACMLVSGTILLAYPEQATGALFFAFYLAGVSYAGQACESLPVPPLQFPRALAGAHARHGFRSTPPRSQLRLGQRTVPLRSRRTRHSASIHEHAQQRLQLVVVDRLLPRRPCAEMEERNGFYCRVVSCYGGVDVWG